MKIIDIKSDIVKEEKPQRKVEWDKYIDKKLPNWHYKYKRAAYAYLLENNPKSVTLTDKPTKSLEKVVVVGGKEGIRNFINKLEKDGYTKLVFSKFPNVGIFSILEVK
jgi:hypothetical protein